ncbi:MAG: aminoacyl-tRNA hydrolase [Nitriliruptoraceae bacterium]
MAASDQRWLVAGLGNPDDEYPHTRHNVGADVVRALASRANEPLKRVRKAKGSAAEIDIAGRRLVCYVPDGYMNNSGGPVQAAVGWYKVSPQHLIVCHDDLDLDIGVVRCKLGGGNAGHNGLRDVDRALGGADYFRIRVGIGRPLAPRPVRSYVLSRFTAEQRPIVDDAVDTACGVVESLIVHGLEPTQNSFHG